MGLGTGGAQQQAAAQTGPKVTALSADDASRRDPRKKKRAYATGSEGGFVPGLENWSGAVRQSTVLG